MNLSRASSLVINIKSMIQVEVISKFFQETQLFQAIIEDSLWLCILYSKSRFVFTSYLMTSLAALVCLWPHEFFVFVSICSVFEIDKTSLIYRSQERRLIEMFNEFIWWTTAKLSSRWDLIYNDDDEIAMIYLMFREVQSLLVVSLAWTHRSTASSVQLLTFSFDSMRLHQE